MKILYFSIILFGLLNSSNGKSRKGGVTVKFINITSTYNPKNVHHFNFTVSPNTNGRKFDIRWNISTEIPNKAMMNIEVFLKQGKARRLVFPYQFDFCRIWDGFMSQTFARMWFKNLKRYGRFPTTCPIYKGYYFLNKMQMEKGSVPPILHGGEFLAKVVMFVDKDNFRDLLFTANLDIEIVKE